MTDRIDKLVDQLANVVRLPSSERPPIRKCAASHTLLSKRRADHDRVSKADLERELFLSGVASVGEQSKAARLVGVTEGALRHWRDLSMTKSLPPRWAIDELQRKRQEASKARRVAG